MPFSYPSSHANLKDPFVNLDAGARALTMGSQIKTDSSPGAVAAFLLFTQGFTSYASNSLVDKSTPRPLCPYTRLPILNTNRFTRSAETYLYTA
jgi:hypothetical protein